VCEHELVGSLCLDLKDVNRFYQPNIGDHFYSHASASCAGQNNCDNEMLAAYDFERVEFRSPVSGPHTNQLVRLLRAWNPSTGDHLYTLSQEEFQNITTNLGYQAEGGNILVSSSPRAGFVPLYRWYNPTNGDHFYTISASEQCMGQSSNSIHCGGETVNEGGWHYEGITAYVVGPKNGNQCPHSMIGGLCLQTQDVNRFYLPTVGDHFYSVASASCAGQNNCDNEMLGAYEFERTEFKTPVNISVANQRHFVRLLRAWNPTSGDHIYTTNLEEFNAITSSGLYRAENAELWVSPTPRAGFVALYRWYNSTNGDHFYTISANEQCMGQTSSSAQCGGETVNEGGWHYEGVAGYVIEP
ncbi:MAG: hypothetical protein MJK18_15295, partial [Bdellovibrionales bacterium]|nr:hypothetical protein [Bdellovibrionales bacterium]